MKKGKITVTITMAIACFALAMIMCMQFKIVRETDITSIETMREEELRTELASWKQMYSEAETQYEEKLAKLNEYKQNQQSSEEAAKLVENDLEKINMYLGKTNVVGEGIIITLKNSVEDDCISAEDLLKIVDYLKLAGAEAISINNERIINTSEIVDISSNSIIFVNQQRILAPYTLKAIGDPSKLESTLLGNGGYVDFLRNLGFDIKIERNNKVKINRYTKDIGYKYMK